MKFLKKTWEIFKSDKLLQKIMANSGYLLSSNVLSMGLSVIQSILAGRLLEWLAGRLSGRPAAGAARVAREARAVVQDVALVRARGVFGRVLLVSLLARLCKYGGLYVLVLALAWPWPPEVRAVLSFPLVLFSLLAAEATASLPISGVAGFGAYEGVMMVALGQAGLSATQAALLPFGLHLLTQTLDYLLGGLALVKLSLGRREPPPAP